LNDFIRVINWFNVLEALFAKMCYQLFRYRQSRHGCLQTMSNYGLRLAQTWMFMHLEFQKKPDWSKLLPGPSKDFEK